MAEATMAACVRLPCVTLAQVVLEMAQAHNRPLCQPITLGAIAASLPSVTVAELHVAVLALRSARLIRLGHWTLSQAELLRQVRADAVLPEHDGEGQGWPEYGWYVEVV